MLERWIMLIMLSFIQIFCHLFIVARVQILWIILKKNIMSWIRLKWFDLMNEKENCNKDSSNKKI